MQWILNILTLSARPIWASSNCRRLAFQILLEISKKFWLSSYCRSERPPVWWFYCQHRVCFLCWGRTCLLSILSLLLPSLYCSKDLRSLSWRTGDHLQVSYLFHVLQVLQTYSMFSNPELQDSTNYRALSTMSIRPLRNTKQGFNGTLASKCMNNGIEKWRTQRKFWYIFAIDYHWPSLMLDSHTCSKTVSFKQIWSKAQLLHCLGILSSGWLDEESVSFYS